jgi:hypothetical protein
MASPSDSGFLQRGVRLIWRRTDRRDRLWASAGNLFCFQGLPNVYVEFQNANFLVPLCVCRYMLFSLGGSFKRGSSS